LCPVTGLENVAERLCGTEVSGSNGDEVCGRDETVGDEVDVIELEVGVIGFDVEEGLEVKEPAGEGERFGLAARFMDDLTV
jgi:hypothetical protein